MMTIYEGLPASLRGEQHYGAHAHICTMPLTSNSPVHLSNMLHACMHVPWHEPWQVQSATNAMQEVNN